MATATFIKTMLVLASILVWAIMTYRSENNRTASEEFIERFQRNKKQDMMGLKDLFGTANNKEPKRCTTNNVMEYLRSEGFQPTRDSYDNPVISFKYQGENLAIYIIDDFCRIFGIWEVKRDEMLPEAVEVILETKQASVSLLQRRLKLGYARAARIVDEMEEMGIVGPFVGSKPRQILITKEQWDQMKLGQTIVTQPSEPSPEENIDIPF